MPLTGTLFGGKSTDLFYLLYRLMPAVRAKFGFRDATQWAATYGRLEHTLVQDDEDDIQLAADVWTHGTRENARSGYFAWGTATSQAGLDALNAGNVTLNFTGPMSVNNATTGNMTLNFGSNPSWTGSWTNPAWSFGAGGTVSGANLISLPDQFTSNVTDSGSFVQGAIVGEQGGPRGITHIIDVTLEGQGRIKDVGRLRNVAMGPEIAPAGSSAGYGDAPDLLQRETPDWHAIHGQPAAESRAGGLRSICQPARPR